jgi:predicted TIM-barrel fold metal-dependent hydrolase
MKPLIPTLLTIGIVSLGIAGAQQLPPGQIRPRPAEGREPELPQPKIREYHPRSTLVVPQHLVPKAKFPVIDFHHHPPRGMSVEAVNEVGDAMGPLNLGLMINANATSSSGLKPALDAIAASRYKGKMAMFVGLDLRNVGPGSGQKIAAQLEADVKAGALGVGEIMKSFGLSVRKADGSRLHLDDPELDPVWTTAARLKIPVFMHTADPAEFFQPLDYKNERWLELALYPDRRFMDRSKYPSFDELMAERDRLIKRHPNTVWVLAHMGWHANDLGRLGRMFDESPNLYGELGAVLYDIGRQPKFAHDFFVKYQDRIIFGKDSYQPDEYPYYWRVFETNDEYFDYYRDYHAFWKLYGIGLPDVVLKKIYYANALRITPNLPRAGFPPL